MTKHKEPNITQQDLNEIPTDLREIYIVREARKRVASDGVIALLHGVFSEEGNNLKLGTQQACIDYCRRLNLPYQVK